MTLSGKTFQEMLLFLRPYVQDRDQCRVYLYQALGLQEAESLNLLWKQPTNTFFAELIRELVNFGEISPGQPALCSFLDTIGRDVGIDVRDRLDKLGQKVRTELSARKASNIALSSLRTLSGHSDTVQTLAISPDSKILVSGGSDKNIKLWCMETGDLLTVLSGYSSGVLSLAFSPDGQTLASSGNLEVGNGCIKLWDIPSRRLRQTLDGGLMNTRIRSLAFSPDGQILATAHMFIATIELWHLATEKVRQTLTGHGWEVNSVAFTADGRFLISGGLDGAIKIWNWRAGKEVRTLKRPPSSEWMSALVSWLDSSVGAIWSVAISPDSRIFASAGSDVPIEVWEVETGKLLRSLSEHSGTVYAVAFSPDGQVLASGGEDHTVRLWRVQTGELLQILKHLAPVKSLVFSPDGQKLVSGSTNGAIQVSQLGTNVT